jgi:hypothetical protein
MAGQNHTEQRQNHNMQGLMILSCHDSVFLLMVAALQRWVVCAFLRQVLPFICEISVICGQLPGKTAKAARKWLPAVRFRWLVRVSRNWLWRGKKGQRRGQKNVQKK